MADPATDQFVAALQAMLNGLVNNAAAGLTTSLTATVDSRVGSFVKITAEEIVKLRADVTALRDTVTQLAAKVAKLEATGPVPTPPPGGEPPAGPPPTEPPPPPPPAGPPSVPPPVVTGWIQEGGSLTWNGSVWSISGGKILRDGQSTPDVSKTKDVLAIAILDGNLTQITSKSTAYRWTGAANWRAIPMPIPQINAAGSVVVEGA